MNEIKLTIDELKKKLQIVRDEIEKGKALFCFDYFSLLYLK